MTRLKAFVDNPVDRVIDPNLPYVALEHIEPGTGVLRAGVELEGKVADDSVGHLPGDVRFGKLRPYLAKSFLATGAGVGSGELIVLRPRPGIYPRFLWYLTLSRPFIDWAVASSYGVKMPRTSWEALGQFDVQLPSIEEQRRIVEYLDTEAARIDDLVSEQEGLIKLLEERRSAAVSTLLARGLRSGVASKHSGIDLLGEIPEHWRMVPTRFVATITTGSEDSGNATEDGEYPFYVRGREILRIGRFSFDCEAVMTPGDGQGGTGKVFHYFDGRFEAHQRVYVFKDFKNITGRYFYYYLSSFLGPVALAGSNTVTMESLRRPLLASFPVALPPMAEQVGIVAEADRQVAVIEQLIAEAQTLCDVARERRAALITAAVTGGLEAVGRVA